MVNYWWAGLWKAPEVVQVYADPHLGRLVLTGEITLGSADALDEALRTHPKYTLIQLESPGGLVIEGLRMERIVRERGLDTVVMEDCASSCTLIFAGGKDRYLGPHALMGFHRSGISGVYVDYGMTETDRQMQEVWLNRGVDKAFTVRALKEPMWRIWDAPQGEMLEAGYATARWVDRNSSY